MIKNYKISKSFLVYTMLVLLAFLSPILMIGQTYNNAFGLGGIYDDNANSVALDSNQNVYIAGSYTDSVDFDPSVSSAILYTVAAPNAFLAKYDQGGNYLWSVSIEGSQPIEIREIVLSNSGFIYAVGDFMGTASFDTSTSYTAMGVFDVFIAKYDTSGNFIWARTFGGPAPDWGYSLAIDSLENIIATGSFTAFADFDASSAVATINAFGGSPDIFLVKYDSAGNYIWAKHAGGNSADEGISVATDQSNNIYVTGSFMSSIADFSGKTVSQIGAADIFIAKYDENGNASWAQAMGGQNNDKGTVLYAKSDELYLSGYFQSTANMDPSLVAPPLVSSGDKDIFLVRFDTAGNYIWSTPIGGSMEDQVKDIQMDLNDNIVLSGFFSSVAYFSTGFSTISISALGGKDIFVSKYDKSGSVISTMGIGGTGDDISNTIAFDDEFFHIAGSFSSSVDFNPSQSSANILTSPANKSIFYAKYAYCKNNYQVVFDTICSGDSFYVDQATSFTTSGSYRVNFSSKNNSCDSILTVHLDVTSIDLNISQTGNTLTSNESGATYQWLDCTADTIVVGETNSAFTATTNGNYSLIIAKNNCIDTTVCINVTSVGLGENNLQSNLIIYPNPSTDMLSIISGTTDTYIIYGVLGEVVKTGTLSPGLNELSLNLTSGVYFIRANQSFEMQKFTVK